MTAKKFEEMFPSLANAEAFTVGGKRFVSLEKVLEIIERLNHNGSVSIKLLRKEIEVLKGGEQG